MSVSDAVRPQRAPRLRGQTAWTLAGLLAPLAAAVWAFPVLLRTLGSDRFGLFALGLSIVGVAGVLDLGLGRAMTRSVGRWRGTADAFCLRGLWRLGTTCALGLGLALALLVGAAATPGGIALLNVGEPMTVEFRTTVLVTALLVPLVILDTVARGFIEGFEAFAQVAAGRVVAGAGGLVAAAVVASQASGLAAVMAALLGARLAALAIVVSRVARELRAYRHGALPLEPAQRRNVLRYTRDLAAVNLLAPALSHLDRFVIPSMISPTALGVYVAPQEVMTKLLILPFAINSVLFPRLAAAAGSGGAQRATRDLARRAARWSIGAVILAAVALGLAAEMLLRLWLGVGYDDVMATMARWFLVGVVGNTVALFPYTRLQAEGHARRTVIAHAIEWPIYAGLLTFAISFDGLRGAAMAWAARHWLDAALLGWMAHRAAREGTA